MWNSWYIWWFKHYMMLKTCYYCEHIHILDLCLNLLNQKQNRDCKISVIWRIYVESGGSQTFFLLTIRDPMNFCGSRNITKNWHRPVNHCIRTQCNYKLYIHIYISMYIYMYVYDNVFIFLIHKRKLIL